MSDHTDAEVADARASKSADASDAKPSDAQVAVDESQMRRLLTSALAVRHRAYAPYSHFQVGAAVLADDGRIYAGCNVENSSYGLCLCAERNAIGQAVARGARKVLAAAVVAPSEKPTPPCGMCLQTFAELGEGEMPILLSTPEGVELQLTLGQLLPYRFDKSFLPAGE